MTFQFQQILLSPANPPANQQFPSIFHLDLQLIFNREDLNKHSRYFFITIKLNKKYSPRLKPGIILRKPAPKEIFIETQKKNLRNQIVAHIFATEWFLK